MRTPLLALALCLVAPACVVNQASTDAGTPSRTSAAKPDTRTGEGHVVVVTRGSLGHGRDIACRKAAQAVAAMQRVLRAGGIGPR